MRGRVRKLFEITVQKLVRYVLVKVSLVLLMNSRCLIYCGNLGSKFEVNGMVLLLLLYKCTSTPGIETVDAKYIAIIG